MAYVPLFLLRVDQHEDGLGRAEALAGGPGDRFKRGNCNQGFAECVREAFGRAKADPQPGERSRTDGYRDGVQLLQRDASLADDLLDECEQLLRVNMRLSKLSFDAWGAIANEPDRADSRGSLKSQYSHWPEAAFLSSGAVADAPFRSIDILRSESASPYER